MFEWKFFMNYNKSCWPESTLVCHHWQTKVAWNLVYGVISGLSFGESWLTLITDTLPSKAMCKSKVFTFTFRNWRLSACLETASPTNHQNQWNTDVTMHTWLQSGKMVHYRIERVYCYILCNLCHCQGRSRRLGPLKDYCCCCILCWRSPHFEVSFHFKGSRFPDFMFVS